MTNDRALWFRMGKGEQTKAAILDEASELASRLGLGGLTIGTLATASKLSKSGLYAHFASKESLQVEVLQYARDQFTDHVMRPTVKTPRGEPRLRAFFENWLAWQAGRFAGGCIFVDAASEFDDQEARFEMSSCAPSATSSSPWPWWSARPIAEGHFRPDVDAAQFAYELEGILLPTTTRVA